MTKCLAAIAAVALLHVNPVHAVVQKAPDNGNQMVRNCAGEEGSVTAATCQGFLSGVIAATQTYATAGQLDPMFCVPRGTPDGEIIAAFTRYVDEHHALNHFPAAILAVSAFKEAYPCKSGSD